MSKGSESFVLIYTPSAISVPCMNTLRQNYKKFALQAMQTDIK